MREFRPYGSVRGAFSDERPYRDLGIRIVSIWTLILMPMGHARSLSVRTRFQLPRSYSNSLFDRMIDALCENSASYGRRTFRSAQ
jgi:hypothetical protein